MSPLHFLLPPSPCLFTDSLFSLTIKEVVTLSQRSSLSNLPENEHVDRGHRERKKTCRPMYTGIQESLILLHAVFPYHTGKSSPLLYDLESHTVHNLLNAPHITIVMQGLTLFLSIAIKSSHLLTLFFTFLTYFPAFSLTSSKGNKSQRIKWKTRVTTRRENENRGGNNFVEIACTFISLLCYLIVQALLS